MKKEKVVNDFLAAWEAHDLTKTVGLLADNFKLIGPTLQPLSKEAFLMFQRVHNEAFPDWTFNVSDIQAIDNEVYVTIRIRATHKGVYDLSKLGLSIPPIPPTGKSRSWPVEYMTCVVKNNKITRIEVTKEPGGGVMGTLEWLGIELPAKAM